jgi:competence protein ComEA
MKAAWTAAFAVALLLIGAGVLQWLGRPPQGQPVKLIPPPTPPPLVVHITGEINQPGVYDLPQGSRLRDAIAAAGGFGPNADSQQLNLAQLLSDGQRILVPAVLAQPLSVGESEPEAVRAEEIVLLPTFPLDINSASQAELEALPEIGPKTAEKIIAYRQEHGLFQSIEEIQNVNGIGPATYEAIKDLILVK